MPLPYDQQIVLEFLAKYPVVHSLDIEKLCGKETGLGAAQISVAIVELMMQKLIKQVPIYYGGNMVSVTYAGRRLLEG